MELNDPKKLKQAKIVIYALSIAIPVIVAVLFGIPPIDAGDTSFLPPIYATINALTAVLLVLALIAIKRKNQQLHKRLIRFCLMLSLLFLGCYVAYHMTSTHTKYEGAYILPYLIILLTHIILSIAVVPLVLFTYLFAWQGNYTRHKKWAKITWPLWFYVAISGVIVYLMISPFYK